MMRYTLVALLLGLLVTLVIAPVYAEPDGPVFAAQGQVKIEAIESARWKALVDDLRKARDASDEARADLRALLEKALADANKALTEAQALTKERDNYKKKAEELDARVRELQLGKP
jgi:hypothetical protein